MMLNVFNVFHSCWLLRHIDAVCSSKLKNSSQPAAYCWFDGRSAVLLYWERQVYMQTICTGVVYPLSLLRVALSQMVAKDAFVQESNPHPPT